MGVSRNQRRSLCSFNSLPRFKFLNVQSCESVSGQAVSALFSDIQEFLSKLPKRSSPGLGGGVGLDMGAKLRFHGRGVGLLLRCSL